MMTAGVRWSISLATSAALMLSASTGHAMRHLKLVRSSPSADTTLAKSPDAIRLWLSEPADAPASKIALTTTAGAKIAIGAVSRDTAKDAPLVAKITTPLPNGGYTVTWKAMSKDGHVVNGTFAFHVGSAK